MPHAIAASPNPSELIARRSALEPLFSAPANGISLTGGANAHPGADSARTIFIDLNQDNIDDRVEIQSGSLSVALGDGRGGFSAARRLPTVTNPADFSGGVSASDWNDDGFPDLAIGSSDGVLICFGDGDGGCQSTRWIPDVLLPSGEMAGDLNGDGHSDLVVLQQTERGWILSGLFGDGNGTLALRPVAPNPDPDARWIGRLEVADRDGDGVIDFIQAGEDSPFRWRRSTDGQFRLDIAKQQNSVSSSADARLGSERAASTWGTTYYGQVLTIAGGGSNSPGDGGPATEAGLSYYPRGLLLDAAQNLYFADGNYGGRVRKVSKATGILSTIAGGGSSFPGDGGLATSAFFYSPQSLAMDTSGNLYVGESACIRKIDKTSGIISTVAGTGSPGFSGDGQLATDAQVNGASGIAIDQATNSLYVADRNNHRIRKVNLLTRMIETVAGNGAAGFSGDGSLATGAKLDSPTAIRVDISGNLLIADSNNGRIRKVTATSGVISTVAGGGGLSPATGVQATAASLSSIADLAIDGSGSIYFTTSSNSLWRLDSSNSLHALPPGWACCSALHPTGAVAVDNLGAVVYADYANGPTINILDLIATKFAISQTQVQAGSAAGTGTFTVTSDPIGGQWTATSDMPWLQVTPTSGTGAATLTYTYSASDSANARTGRITVNGQTLWVYQEGAIPTFSLSPTSATLSGQAANGTVNLTVSPADAHWVVTGNPTWLTLGPSSGIGNAPITYGASTNLSTDARTGTFKAQNANYFYPQPSSSDTFTLTQAPAATAILSPPNSSVGAGAGSFAAQLTTTPSGAAWSAYSDAAWLIPSPSTGAGNASLTVSHTRNNTIKTRTGTISVGNQKITVTQVSAAVAYSLWPTSWWGQIMTIGGGGDVSPGDGGPATAASLQNTASIAVDSASNVYFTANGGIRRIDSASGLISTLSSLNTYADRIAIDPADDLYYSQNNSIYKHPRFGGEPQLIAGGGSSLGDGGQAVAAQLDSIGGMTLGTADRMFVTEVSGHRVRKIDLSTGIISTVAGVGTAGFTGDGGLAVNAQLRNPNSVAVDAAGNLFIADDGNNRIRMVAGSTGMISTFAGGGTTQLTEGQLATNAILRSPSDVRLGSDGSVYFRETPSNSWNMTPIRRVDRVSGTITTMVGAVSIANANGDGDSAVGASLANATGIAFDSIGNLYIAQGQFASPARIRYVDYVSPRSTLSSNQLVVSAAAGSGTVQLTSLASTGAWKLTNQNPTWLTVGPGVGTGDTTLTFSYTANTSSSTRTGTFTVRGQLFTLTQSGSTYLSLNRSSLYFGASTSGAATPPEVVSITQTSGIIAAPWSVTTDQPWCKVTPLTGAGSGKITISVDTRSAPSSGTSTCRVTIVAPGASPSTYTISTYLKTTGSSSAPPLRFVRHAGGRCHGLSGQYRRNRLGARRRRREKRDHLARSRRAGTYPRQRSRLHRRYPVRPGSTPRCGG